MPPQLMTPHIQCCQCALPYCFSLSNSHRLSRASRPSHWLVCFIVCYGLSQSLRIHAPVQRYWKDKQTTWPSIQRTSLLLLFEHTLLHTAKTSPAVGDFSTLGQTQKMARCYHRALYKLQEIQAERDRDFLRRSALLHTLMLVNLGRILVCQPCKLSHDNV